jgi:hypothetical protein
MSARSEIFNSEQLKIMRALAGDVWGIVDDDDLIEDTTDLELWGEIFFWGACAVLARPDDKEKIVLRYPSKTKREKQGYLDSIWGIAILTLTPLKTELWAEMGSETIEDLFFTREGKDDEEVLTPLERPVEQQRIFTALMRLAEYIRPSGR